MDKKSKEQYNYERVYIYFNLDDPYQKECCDLLKKIQKKKSLFLGLLAHNFLSQFKNEQTLTSDNLKTYIQYYEVMEKKREQIQLTPVNNIEEQLRSVTETKETASITQSQSIENATSEVITQEQKTSDKFDEDKNEIVLKAMSTFKY